MTTVLNLFHTTILQSQVNLAPEVIDNIHRYAAYRIGQVENPEQVENILDDEQTRLLCPELAELKSYFVELFEILLKSYQGNNDVHFDIEIGAQKVSVLNNSHRSWIHSHVKVDAFAILYLDDLKPQQGGELVLYDPKFHESVFNHGNYHKITPKKGLVVVAPNYIWHEVNTYRGEKPRLAIVINCVVNQLK